MSASAIRAGQAYVELATRDNLLNRGLKAAQQKLKTFAASTNAIGRSMSNIGASTAKLGGVITGIGGASLAGLGALTKGFADAGGAIDDMAQRTGLSAETVSRLSYAAKMTGSSMEDVEKATRTMGVTLADAAAGSATSEAKLSALGITLSQLRGLAPDQQFALIADKLAKIADPGTKAAAAMDIFGKSGANLVPLLSGGSKGIADLMAEADALGLVMSGKDAAAAAEFGDALDKISGSVESVRNAIAASLAPVLTKLSELLVLGIGKMRNFINDNREMVVRIAAVSAGVAVAGGALVTFGATIAAVGFGLSGLATALGIVGTAIGLVSTITTTAVTIMGAVTTAVAVAGGALRGLAATSLAVGAAMTTMSTVSSIATTVMAGVSATVAFVGRSLRILVATAYAAGAAIASMSSISSISTVVMAGVTTVVRGVAASLRSLTIITTVTTGAFAAMSAVMAAITSPVGLAIAAVAALGAAIYTYSDAGIAALGKLGAKFKEMFADALPALEGIKKAIMSSQWAEAGQLLWTSLEIAWRTGTDNLYGIWTDFSTTVMNTWDSLTTNIVSKWQTAVNWIAKKLLWVYSLFDKAIEYEKAAAQMDSELKTRQTKSQEESQGRMDSRIGDAAARKDEFMERIKELKAQRDAALAAINAPPKEADNKNGTTPDTGSSVLGGILGAMMSPGALLLNPQTWATIQKGLGSLRTQADATTNPATKPDATAVGGTFSGFAAAIMGGSVSTFDRLLDKTNELVEFAKITAENTGADKAVAFGP